MGYEETGHDADGERGKEEADAVNRVHACDRRVIVYLRPTPKRTKRARVEECSPLGRASFIAVHVQASARP
jgi:hypothetical protein